MKVPTGLSDSEIQFQACDWGIFKKPKHDIKSPAGPTIVGVTKKIFFFFNSFLDCWKMDFSKQGNDSIVNKSITYLHLSAFSTSTPLLWHHFYLNPKKNNKQNSNKNQKNHIPAISICSIQILLRNSAELLGTLCLLFIFFHQKPFKNFEWCFLFHLKCSSHYQDTEILVILLFLLQIF